MGDFEHIGGVASKSVWNAESYRKTFGLQSYPEADLARDVERLTREEEWLDEQSEEMRKLYTLAVKHAELHGKPYLAAMESGPWLVDGETGEIVGRKKEECFRYTFEGFEERCQHPRMLDLAGWMKEIACGERRRGIFMWGKPGTYKTWLMMALMGLAREHDVDAVVWDARDLVEDVQSTYGDGQGSKRQIFDLVLKSRIVCLDDLGREKGTDDASQIIADFVDAIYLRQDERTLVIATNLSREDIGQSYEPAVLSRIRGMCDGFELPIGDTRGPLMEVLN